MKKFTMGLPGLKNDAASGERVRIAPSVSVLIGGGCSSHSDRSRSVTPALDPAGGLAHQCSQLGRIDGISQHEGLDQRVRHGFGQARLSAGMQHRELPFESTVRYLGIEVDDALSISKQVEL
jgi:hypothetical protein